MRHGPPPGTQITVFREGAQRAIRAVVPVETDGDDWRKSGPKRIEMTDGNGHRWFPYELVEDGRTERNKKRRPKVRNFGGGHRRLDEEGITWMLGWGEENETVINAAYALWKAGRAA